MKNLVVLSVLSVLLVANSCKPPDPAQFPLVPTTLRLTTGTNFLGFCSQFFEGGSDKEFELTIDVIGYSGDPNLPSNYMWSDVVEINNDEWDVSGQSFDLQLPETGGFLVDVKILGKETSSNHPNNCFTCCNQMQTPSGATPCNFPNKGRPRFAATSPSYDVGNPPATITLEPTLLTCVSCGCQ